MAAIRTFISFAPPPDIREDMRKLQEQLKLSNADVKWEHADQFHATIKFLGGVEERVMPDVLAKIQIAAGPCRPFSIIYQSLGAFPSLQHPRIVWIGCKTQDDTIQGLKDRLDSALFSDGFQIEERAFHPHITLGRVKSQRNLLHLTPMLEKCTFEPRRTMVDGIFVMKSVLTPQGAVYSTIQSIHLRSS